MICNQKFIEAWFCQNGLNPNSYTTVPAPANKNQTMIKFSIRSMAWLLLLGNIPFPGFLLITLLNIILNSFIISFKFRIRQNELLAGCNAEIVLPLEYQGANRKMKIKLHRIYST